MTQKKMIITIVTLVIIVISLISIITFNYSLPLRNCINDVMKNEANYNYDKAKDICKQIGNLNSIETN